MNKTVIAVAAIAFWGFGYFGGVAQGQENTTWPQHRRLPIKGFPRWERVMWFLTR